MKLNFKNHRGSRRQPAHSDLSGLTSAAADFSVRAAGPQPSQRGIALVITLILLSVTLVMAVAFLALSRRERGAVATSTSTTTARLAGDSALANAEGEIIANVLSTTNPYASSLLVSMNASFVADPNNPADYANLQSSPRVPVLMTNLVTGQLENRFYLDLNRNGQDDPSGMIVDPVTGATNFETGDPEWIGVLEQPDEPYGPDNLALARYAFIAVPADNGLDLNAIHNQTLNPSLSFPLNDGYFRNQGVGSWEINLAAFLADLNTNQWDPPTIENALVNSPYEYNPPPGVGGNQGVAFEDAFSLLTNRYAGNYNTLAPFSSLGYPDYEYGVIDSYTAGILMTNVHLDGVIVQQLGTPWAGSDNTNQFFDLMSDLFDPSKSSTAFTNRLSSAGNGTNNYDRYTFYRWLGEMGTDSDPESGKMNLNYDNLDPYVFTSGGVTYTNAPAATNFMAWTPLGFFTNAADRMLRLYTTNWFLSGPANYLATYYATNYLPPITVDGYGDVSNLFIPSLGISDNVPAFGITNIPVFVNGQFVYSPAVNRILQLAANMYDAVYYTNHFVPASGSAPAAYMPSVFQPVFNVDNNNNVYINGFVEVTNAGIFFATNYPLLNLNAGATVINFLQSNPNALVFGVPVIIGAKKGFPNFNQFAMQNEFWIERKLQVTRTSITEKSGKYQYNQEFFVGITNQMAVECWNSYLANYDRPINIYVNDYVTVALTNDENFADITNAIISGFIQIPNQTNSVWPGTYYLNTPNSGNFQIPLNANIAFVPGELYRFNGGSPYLTTNTALPFETDVNVNGSSYPQPNWGLNITNNLQVLMLDASSGKIVDYVQLSGPNATTNITQGLTANIPDGSVAGLWNTNIYTGGEPWGVANQITYSENDNAGVLVTGDNGTWVAPMESNIVFFDAFMNVQNPYGITASANTNLSVQAPFTPSAAFYQYTTWQANDPLVHYLASDLTDTAPHGTPQNPLITPNVNERYQPWGGTMLQLPNSSVNSYDPAFKDPLATNSDAWDFPVNKFPTAGWLGRVHRGTPWQTVYLKSSDVWAESAGGIGTAYGHNTWMNWTGDQNANDAANSSPTWDWWLFDLFTTAPDDNATRGQLSVNVGANDPGDPEAGLAAWSALFSGIVVPPVSATNSYGVISPAGVYDPANPPPLVQIVQGINYARTNKTNLDGVTNVFEHIGDILSVPALTVQSPYLNLANTNYNGDEMYEWLPQQVMSLLRVSNEPRYVIYCYGQALKPAPGGIVTGGPSFGMVTNYQVVSETAARAVIRVEDAKTTHPHIVVESFNLLPPY